MKHLSSRACAAALLVAALLIGGGLTGCGKAAPADAKADTPAETPVVAVEMATAERRPVETTVSAQGTLSPGQGAVAHVAAASAGKLVAVRVREGDRVNAGDIVAVVDNRVGQALTRSAEAALTASEATARQADLSTRALETDQANAVRAARLGLQSAQLDRANAVQSAQTALEAARTDLKKTQAGARPQEIAQADQAVTQAKVTRSRAETELKRVQFLNDKGIAPRRQLDDAETALAVAESTLESAQQAASLVRAGARQEDIRAAELRVQQAQEAQTQAGKSGDAKIAQAQAVLRQAQQSGLQIDAKRQEAQAARQTSVQKRADLAAATVTAQLSDLRAPISGIVTRRALNPGDSADTTTPVVEITDSRSLNLIASLPADEGGVIRPGMAARIQSQDAPGKTYAGQVLSVGQVDPQTNLLSVRIGVSNAAGSLKSGAFATADIVVRGATPGIVVPKQAIITKEGKSVVFTVGADGVAHQKEVVVGTEQNGFVEIQKGVASGEKVVSLGQYELADGAKVKEAEKADAKGETDKAGGDKAGADKAGADKEAGAK